MNQADEIKAKDVLKLLVKTLSRHKAGEINDRQAYREAYLINVIIKCIEVADIQERLARIEEVMRNAKE